MKKRSKVIISDGKMESILPKGFSTFECKLCSRINVFNIDGQENVSLKCKGCSREFSTKNILQTGGNVNFEENNGKNQNHEIELNKDQCVLKDDIDPLALNENEVSENETSENETTENETSENEISETETSESEASESETSENEKSGKNCDIKELEIKMPINLESFKSNPREKAVQKTRLNCETGKLELFSPRKEYLRKNGLPKNLSVFQCRICSKEFETNKGPFIYYVSTCRGGGGSENANFC